jgi:hypothetical protein
MSDENVVLSEDALSTVQPRTELQLSDGATGDEGETRDP